MNRLTLAHSQPLLAVLAMACISVSGCAAVPPMAPEAAAAAPGTGAGSGAAAADATLEQRFARWLDGMRDMARAGGIDATTIHSALDTARYLPRVIELDRAQPEFTRAIWDYLDGTVTSQRVALGKEKLKKLRAEVDAAAARYGVAPEILVSIWGIESNFGSNYGDIPTVDALATLGFEGRRGDWARGQLLAALRILQSRDIDRAHMVGSWAGAMGQTQFLPTTFLDDAVDADGDGRRDIWGSMADVMASTANNLSRAGWVTGQPWGVEVRLPLTLDIARADGELRQPSARWTAEGVRTVTGAPLPQLPDAALLLPAGVRGPAFLVGPNFRAILRYNNSINYALAVGLLAQRLADGPGVQATWPRDLTMLTRTQLMALQTALNERGFPSGAPDGMLGPATRGGLRGYQRSIGLPPDGYPTLDLLVRLQAPTPSSP